MSDRHKGRQTDKSNLNKRYMYRYTDVYRETDTQPDRYKQINRQIDRLIERLIDQCIKREDKWTNRQLHIQKMLLLS